MGSANKFLLCIFAACSVTLAGRQKSTGTSGTKSSAPKSKSSADQSAEDVQKSAQASPVENCSPSDAINRPNIVFIMLDDLGWGDLSATTGQFPTPNMDALYTNAIQIKRHYVHLMCSPSRTQFLTGRYAMNLGFGEFIPWDDAEIGGIPIGQPTVANWLRDYGAYHTYGVGKWQVGYANTQLTPRAKGFEHFYGFYQGAIDYVTKTYNDIVYGDIGVYDFFEDEEACYDVIDSPTDTMSLYSAKIIEYLNDEAAMQSQAVAANEIPTPFFLFASLQSLHVPLPVLPEFEAQCEAQVAIDATLPREEQSYLRQRRLYCQLTLKTDAVIGEIIGTLKDLDLYDDTLVVFTSDNGGETDRGASNFPFRGTKGELYEGNTRTLTAVTGGVIEQRGLSGLREAMVSNLDWTPTLLSLAGYLECIDEADRTWDGVDQMAMLLSDGVVEERDSLVLNVGDDELRSARILVRVGERLFKYAKSDSTSAADRWIYSDRLSDVWTQPMYSEDGLKTLGIDVVDYDESKAELMFSQVFEDRFLFDLTSDESEKYNLLNPELPHFDAALNDEVVARSEALLSAWMAENKDAMFSAPIDFLHERLKAGEPDKTGDGKFVRPFLSDREYKFMVTHMLEAEGEAVPQGLRELYLVAWVPPSEVSDIVADEVQDMVTEELEERGEQVMDVSLLLPVGLAAFAVVLVLCAIAMYYCLRKRCKQNAVRDADYRASLVRVSTDEDNYHTFIGQ